MASGLEDYPRTDQTYAIIGLIPLDRLNEIRRDNIRRVVGQKEKLLAKDTAKRPHRKTSHRFSMSFVEMNKLMADNWRVCDRLARAVFKELAGEGRKIYQLHLANYNNHLASGKEELISSLNSQDVNIPKIEHIASGEKASSVSTKNSSPAAPSIEESNLGKFIPDLSWEPLPFKDQELPKASPSQEVCSTPPKTKVQSIPEADIPSVTDTVKHLLSEKHFNKPKFHDLLWFQDRSYHSPMNSKSCISAIVTPTMGTKPSVIPTRMDIFDANCDGIEPISHIAPPSSLFAMPAPPFLFKTECPSIRKKEEWGSPGASLKLENVASVDDFMELIAALDEN
eukprot:4947_1